MEMVKICLLGLNVIYWGIVLYVLIFAVIKRKKQKKGNIPMNPTKPKSEIRMTINKKIKKSGTGKPVIKVTSTGRLSAEITLER